MTIWRLVFIFAGFLGAAPARADLFDYIKKPDGAFSWKLDKKTESAAGTVYTLKLVSQKWQGITWEHDVQVFLPKGVKPGAKMFLWNQGGKAGLQSTLLGMEMARRMQAPVAFVFGIPNQPLLDGKSEDGLIAETFVRYLKTKDEDWPLLFPMVKSLVRAMDALEQFAKAEWNVELTAFVVSGASKRGWTTWLTAAADPRVKAIAPLVIDTLNFGAQIPHQLESFGKYSEMIKDYTSRGLVPLPDTPEAKKLWLMVDPYFYRDKITVPRMIINGANDPYWTTDALNLYWEGLKGDKWVLYVPNAGHNLEQKHADGKKDRDRVLNTLGAFVRHQMAGTAPPKLTWKHDDQNGKFRLTATADPAPRGARLWVATAPTRDFRQAAWKEQEAKVHKGVITGLVSPPGEGFLAFFAEIDFEVGDLRYTLSTQMRMAGKAR